MLQHGACKPAFEEGWSNSTLLLVKRFGLASLLVQSVVDY